MNKPTGVTATLKTPEFTKELDLGKSATTEYVIAPSGLEQPLLKAVSVTLGHTKNIGNFQSLNVSVSCTEYAQHRDASFKDQLDWCKTKLDETFEFLLSSDHKNLTAQTAKASPKINPAAAQLRSDDLDL